MRFDPQKAIHAASVLARQEPNKTLTRLRLLKLLYIADRRMMERKGRPLLNAQRTAMNNGPLHSEVYNLIKGVHLSAPKWDKHFKCDGPRNVVMYDEPPPGTLTESEIKLLIEVSKEYEDFDEWELVNLTHSFQEWKDSHQKDTSRPIEFGSFIKATGRSQDEAQIREDMEASDNLDRLLEAV